MNKIRLWSTYRSNNFEELISGDYTATDNFIDALIVLKKNGVNLVYLKENGKRANAIQNKYTIKKMLEAYQPKLTEDQKEKIRAELEEIGINKKIGQSLSEQKKKQNIEKFSQAVLELQQQLKEEGIELSEEEIKSLMPKEKTSQDLGKATYDATTAGCDKMQEFMQGLEQTIKESGRAG